MPTSDEDFSYLVHQIQKEMAQENLRRRVPFPEGALGLEQSTSILRPTEVKRHRHTYSAGGVVNISSVERDSRARDTMQGQIEAERKIQQSIAYGVAPGIHVGWWAKVFDGENWWRYWRPFRRWADHVGRYVVRQEVRMRQRRWAYQHPEMRTARDLWIVPPTDLESWVEAYKHAEGKQ